MESVLTNNSIKCRVYGLDVNVRPVLKEVHLEIDDTTITFKEVIAMGIDLKHSLNQDLTLDTIEELNEKLASTCFARVKRQIEYKINN